MKHASFSRASGKSERAAAECADLQQEVERLRHENDVLNMMLTMMGAELDIMGVCQGSAEPDPSQG